MIKKLILFVMLILCYVGNDANANIIAETDNYTQSVVYRVYDKLNTWNVNRYEFVKNITDNGDTTYFFVVVTKFIPQKDVHLVAGSKYLLDRNLEFIIDGKIVQAKKIVQHVGYPQTINEGNFREWVYYSISNDVINYFKNAKHIQFSIRAIKGKTFNFIMKNNILLEIKKVLSNGNFDNYLEI